MFKSIEITIRDSQGNPETITGYDKNGNVAYEIISNKNRRYDHQYNNHNMIETTYVNDGSSVHYKYKNVNGELYISSRIIHNPNKFPEHIVVEYETSSDRSKVYEYRDDELNYIRLYDIDSSGYDRIRKIDGNGKLISTKLKYRETGLIRRIIDSNRDSKYIYNDDNKLTKIIKNKLPVNRFLYNDKGEMIVHLEYQYDNKGSLTNVIAHEYKYEDGLLKYITLNGEVVKSYEYKQLNI